MIRELDHRPRIAYFSMEVALRSEMPTYGGGLGVLAGDVARTAADLDLPMITVTLASRAGYFRQEVGPGGQGEQPDPWDPSRWAVRIGARVAVEIEGRCVWVGGWLHEVAGRAGGSHPVVLLDTDLEDNAAADRRLTDVLYGGDAAYRLKQEIVLGIGGVRMLRAMGVEIRQFHLNEGHAALLGLELLRQHRLAPGEALPGDSPYDVSRVRSLCTFTTHTPVDAGHDRFDYALVGSVLGDLVEMPILQRLAGPDCLNMTRLALNLSEFVNGVAKRHAETSQRMFPGHRVRAITNGVHPGRWTAPAFARLYNRALPGWSHETELLVRADCCIPDDAIWDAHLECKGALLARVRALTGVELDPELPTLGFARRMTAYKRPTLLFADLSRLRAIAGKHPFQVVLAGKAHPRDEEGKRLISRLREIGTQLQDHVRVAYLPGYDLELAQILVAGADLWVNTPLPPLEASGTSGMKAALNGVPSLSVLDGWWSEGCIEGITGWAIGTDDAASDDHAGFLYDKLEHQVLPLFHRDRARWIKVMKGAISRNGAFFSSHRMMRRYVAEAYLRHA